jgi:hypothetical protein
MRHDTTSLSLTINPDEGVLIVVALGPEGHTDIEGTEFAVMDPVVAFNIGGRLLALSQMAGNLQAEIDAEEGEDAKMAKILNIQERLSANQN